MTEFAVLLLLSEAPDRRMRMSALAAAVGLTSSRITRVVDGLSRHDMVQKERHGQDGRGSDAILTDTGLRAMRPAQPSHLASARRRVLDHIPRKPATGPGPDHRHTRRHPDPEAESDGSDGVAAAPAADAAELREAVGCAVAPRTRTRRLLCSMTASTYRRAPLRVEVSKKSHAGPARSRWSR